MSVLDRLLGDEGPDMGTATDPREQERTTHESDADHRDLAQSAFGQAEKKQRGKKKVEEKVKTNPAKFGGPDELADRILQRSRRALEENEGDSDHLTEEQRSALVDVLELAEEPARNGPQISDILSKMRGPDDEPDEKDGGKTLAEILGYGGDEPDDTRFWSTAEFDDADGTGKDSGSNSGPSFRDVLRKSHDPERQELIEDIREADDPQEKMDLLNEAVKEGVILRNEVNDVLEEANEMGDDEPEKDHPRELKSEESGEVEQKAESGTLRDLLQGRLEDLRGPTVRMYDDY